MISAEAVSSTINAANAAVNAAAVVGTDTHSMVSAVILQLLIAFIAAKAVGFGFEKLKQPAVVGELLAGMILGPYVLNILQLNDPAFHLTFEVLAEVGVIFLLFAIGLETRIGDMSKVGLRAFLVAAFGVIVPFFLGFLYMKLTGHENMQSLFMGAVMVATSVGITARILKDLNFLSDETSRIILGAAVIDDVLGLIVLSTLSGIAQSGTFSLVSVLTTIGIITVFIIAFTAGGIFLIKRFAGRGIIRKGNIALIAGSAVCFIFAMVASNVGLAAIVGAFMAGLVMAEVESEFEIREQVETINEMFVVFFFVIMGAKVNLGAFFKEGILLTGIIITVLAFIGKNIGCGLPVLKMGFKKAAFIGMGMAPRGEVGIIIAAFALSKGIIDENLYGVAIFMVLMTTFIPPFFLAPMIRGIKKGKHS